MLGLSTFGQVGDSGSALGLVANGQDQLPDTKIKQLASRLETDAGVGAGYNCCLAIEVDAGHGLGSARELLVSKVRKTRLFFGSHLELGRTFGGSGHVENVGP